MMRTSPRGIEDLILSEGLRLKAYKDSVGVWTIGVGHAATSGKPPIPRPGMTITRDEALRIFRNDLARYEADVNEAFPNGVPQHVFDGAVSFHFNTGAIKSASWPKKYKLGDKGGARKAFMTWRKPPEIIGRRTREAELIFDGRYRSPPIDGQVTPTDPTNPVLRRGDGITVNVTMAYANAIKEVQKLLASHGFNPGIPDGMFGEMTETMVKRFQAKRNLVADGVIGPATWGQLRSASKPAVAVPPPPDIPSVVPHPLEPDLPDIDDPDRAETIKPVEWLIAVGVIGGLLIAAVLGFKFLT